LRKLDIRRGDEDTRQDLFEVTTMQMMEPPGPNASESNVALTYRFGRYLLDVARRRLLSGSEIKPLPEKLFGSLVLVLEANCRLVEKRVFFDRLWPDAPVTDANLTQHVFMLRGLLGENAGDHTYVVTVPGKGYRFAVPIESKLGLAMKGSCERCARPLAAFDEAYICSYECTFCATCSRASRGVCPNCGGEQTPRPRRASNL
jgi:DNA-binding winged helix-turn-helix (wHTH) protein